MDLTHTLHISGFQCSPADVSPNRHYKLSIKEVKGHTQGATIVLSPWHWSDTLSLITCVSVSLSVCPSSQMRPCSKVTTSLSVFGLTHTYTHTHQGLTGLVSACVVTLHIKLWRLLWLHTLKCNACVCAGVVNTFGRAAAVWTLSLFSSQRSVWKAHCVNRGVAEQAVQRHFLTFSSEHSAAQWWAASRHFLFPEGYSGLFAVWSSCTTLHREWMAVRVTKGEQWCCIESLSIHAVRRRDGFTAVV